MSDFFASPETRKAKKTHKCHTCFRRIDPGEQYSTQFAIYDGNPHRFKQCAHCVAVWSIWAPEDGDGLISENGYDTWQCDADARSVAELRAMVHFRQQWRRKDGTLHPLPNAAKVAA